MGGGRRHLLSAAAAAAHGGVAPDTGYSQYAALEENLIMRLRSKEHSLQQHRQQQQHMVGLSMGMLAIVSVKHWRMGVQ